MSMRTLIEINHDYSDRLDDPAFVAFLQRYLASGGAREAEQLERFGVRVVGMRHHSSKYVIKGDADGFPPTYLDKPKSAAP